MSVQQSERPPSPTLQSAAGARISIPHHITSPVATTPESQLLPPTLTSTPSPEDDAAVFPPPSLPSTTHMPTSFSFPGDVNFPSSGGVARSVPRDDSGLSIVSLSRSGQPSDSGYGTDSPASLNMGALRFRFGSGEVTEYVNDTSASCISPLRSGAAVSDSVGVQVEPDELDFDLELNEDYDDDYGDDDVFLDVVPEEEVDGDDDYPERAFPRRPVIAAAAVGLRRDVVDGPGTWHGGSDGQTDTSTEEDEDSSNSSSGGGSNPITIPRQLRTEGLEYAVALAYTPPSSGMGTRNAAILLARGNFRQQGGGGGALWSLTQAQLSRGPSSFSVHRAALFAAAPHGRNGFQHVQVEEPFRRYSDGVDPRHAPSAMSQASTSGRPVGAAETAIGGAVGPHHPWSAPPSSGGRRCQSESAALLEQQWGQELRRISDEFHMSYQSRTPTGARAIPGRMRSSSGSGSGIPHSSSLPDRPRRGSLVDRFISLFTSSPSNTSPSTSGSNNVDDTADVFLPRRRAQSEIFMASGVTAGAFGRQESLLSAASATGSSASASPDRQLSRNVTADFDEVDGESYDREDNEDDKELHHAIFHLSTDEQ